MIENENFSNQKIPSIISNEYYDCNFSFPEPLMIDGVAYGHPLDIQAKLVRCNLKNREPGNNVTFNEPCDCNTVITSATTYFGKYNSETSTYDRPETPREAD